MNIDIALTPMVLATAMSPTTAKDLGAFLNPSAMKIPFATSATFMTTPLTAVDALVWSDRTIMYSATRSGSAPLHDRHTDRKYPVGTEAVIFAVTGELFRARRYAHLGKSQA